MNRYPSANSIIKKLRLPYPDEVQMVDEFINGRNDYPENAKKLGEASDKLCRLADFMKYFLETRKKTTQVFFGEDTYGNAYLHEFDQIHIQKPNLITGLHEIGHAIYGKSELDACIFSTALILKTEQMKDKIPIFVNHKLINLSLPI